MMTLSEEEKQRIIEEERIRAEARAKYSPSQQVTVKKRGLSTGAGCLIIIIAIVVIPMILSSAGVGNLKDKSNKSPQPTEDVTVKNEQRELISKIELLNPRIELNIIEQEEFQVTVKNNTGRDIDAVRFTGSFQNNFGETVRDWSGNSTYKSGYQGVIKAGASEAISEQLVTWRNPTKVLDLQVVQVHFVDGEDISLE